VALALAALCDRRYRELLGRGADRGFLAWGLMRAQARYLLWVCGDNARRRWAAFETRRI
jgi:hypothetical protein